MSTYLVSPSGDDTTGDGSYAAPFKTIRHAAFVASTSPVDVIEVAEGVTAETLAISNSTGFHVLRGRGADRSIVTLNLTGGWFPIASSSASRILIIDLTIRTLGTVDVLSATADDDTASGVTFARCRISLVTDANAIAYSGPDPQDFVPKLTTDLLHCVVEGPAGAQAGSATSGVGSPIGCIAIRNCILRHLAAANEAGTQPFDSDGNLYFDDFRDLTLGSYGPMDLRGTDPLLVDDTVNPQIGSPVIGAGVDLSGGYGNPPRTPPVEVGLGPSPSIGIVEPVTSGSRAFVTTTNIHTILSSLAVETALERADMTQVERDRAIATASGIELSRRFGNLLGVRFTQSDVESYRKVLTEVLEAIVGHAPSWHALRRAAQSLIGKTITQVSPILFDGTLQKRDFFREYHFKVGSKLKLWADISGGTPTWTFYLSAGEILLEDRWIPVRKTTFSVAHTTAVHTVYCDGSAPVDSDSEAIIHTTTSPLLDESLTAVSGLYTFRRGETLVEATADIPATVKKHRRITTGFFPSDYVVDSVDDARHLTLRHPFPEEDHVGVAYVITPNRIFGTVAVDASTGITRIVCPGRAGRTIFPRTKDSRGHGYELVLDSPGTAFSQAAPTVRSLFEILGRMHPVHKLGFFRLRDDTRNLVLGQPWPYAQQSDIDYAEIFDDPAWFGI